MTTPAHEELASRLLARLRPLFPAIAAATKTVADTRAWVAAWALVIKAEGLDPEDVARGIQNIAKAPHDHPLTPAVFVSLCRPPSKKVEGWGWEAHNIRPPALPEPPDHRAARRALGSQACMDLLAALHGQAMPGRIPSIHEAAELLSKINPTRKKIFL